MASIAERLALLITANPDDAIRGLNKLERTADRAVGATNNRMDDLGHSLTRVGAGMLSVGVLGGVGLARAARSTSDLNEAVSLTEAIFGDAADEIGEFSAGAASSIGQSERAAREATATFGGLLDNLGFAQDETVAWSKDLTVLASDLGSAFNTDPADAVLALGSALRGESEPIRRYNVMLDDATVRARAVEMGLAATSAEVDNHGKVQARLALIMEQTNSVQGNFADTSDGMANAQRTFNAQLENFQAALGQGVLPAMESVLGKGTDLLEWFNDLDPATQKTIATVATWTTGLLIAGGAMSTVAGQAIKARENLSKLASAIGNMDKKTAAVAVGVFALAAAVIYLDRKFVESSTNTSYREGMERRQQAVEDLAATLDDASGALTNLSVDFLAAEIQTLGFADAFVEAGLTGDRLIEAVENAGDASNDAASDLAVLTSALLEQSGAGDENWMALINLLGGYGDAKRLTRDVATLTGELTDEIGDATSQIDDYERAWSDLIDELIGGLSAQTDAMLLVEETADAIDDLDGKSTAEVRAEIESFARDYASIAGTAQETGEDVSAELAAIKANIFAMGVEAQLSAGYLGEIGAGLNAIDGQVANATVNIAFNQTGQIVNPELINPPTFTTGGGSYGGLTKAEWEKLEVNLSIDGTQVDTVLTDIKRRNGGI